jgi:hypothetical protein
MIGSPLAGPHPGNAGIASTRTGIHFTRKSCNIANRAMVAFALALTDDSDDASVARVLDAMEAQFPQHDFSLHAPPRSSD